LGEDVDPRADIYSVGLVLYSMLVGRGPFDHLEGDERLLRAHALEAPEPPSRYAVEPIPQELDRAVLKALAKDPDDRFQTADEFQACLIQIADSVRRPAGWLETMAFDASGMLGPPGAAEEPPMPLPSPPVSAARSRVDVQSAQPPPVPGQSVMAAESPPPERRPKPRRMGVATVLLFLAGMVVAGLAVLGLVTILQGAQR
jgi:serine/threonine-protein kinase